jgi:mannose-6-phosphate isomerase
MGTHPSGPATDDSGVLLSKILADDDSLTGPVPVDYPANDLPFLFKVLSVESALSIQVY